MVGLGAIGGVISALASEGFKFFKQTSERKHELKLLDMQIALGKQETERETAIAAIESQTEMLTSARKHDAAIKDTSLWVANLRASLRPIVTYLVIVIAFILYFTSSVDSQANQLSDMQEAIVASFLMLMEAVTAFWFTGRVVNRDGHK